MIDETNCSNLIDSEFFKDLKAGKDAGYLIEKHILHNVPFYFKNNMDLFFSIKKQIGEKYNIPITNIFLVGSGQLGFSLNPENKYRNFVFTENEKYKKSSDLDFAIISEKLFNMVWDEICGFRLGEIPHDDKDRKMFYDFENYLFKGWIRPDMFPFNYPQKKQWFEFFKQLNDAVNRKVNCGIFRNETSFLNQYKRSINELINIVRMEEIV